MIPPFVAALGPAFEGLPEPIRALHGAAGRRRWTGKVTVTGERGPAAWAMGLAGLAPPHMTDAPFAIEIVPEADGETWRRDFDGHLAVTDLRFERGAIRERVGPVTLTIDAAPVPNGLSVRTASATLLGVPIPARLMPQGRVALCADGPRYHFDVAMRGRAGRLALRYAGWLLPA